MLTPFKVLIPAVAAAFLAAPAFADGPTWYGDYDVAAKEAASSGKDMLVDFTGSDWCIWCKRLDSEVFSFEAFQKGVADDFVLVALDFPNSEEVKAKVPNPERNDALQAQYNITGFPTILLMNSKGEVYARTGYQQGGPEKYVEHLHELQKSGKAALARVGVVIGAYDTAEGAAKLAAWDDLATFAETLDGESPFAARVAAPLKDAFTSDAKNEQGRKLRALKALFALGQMDADMLAAAKELDPANEAGLLEQTVQAKFSGVRDEASARAAIAALTEFEAAARFKDNQLAIRMYANVAMWLAGPLEDAEAAEPWANKALQLKPDDARLVEALQKIAAGGDESGDENGETGDDEGGDG